MTERGRETVQDALKGWAAICAIQTGNVEHYSAVSRGVSLAQASEAELPFAPEMIDKYATVASAIAAADAELDTAEKDTGAFR